MAEIDVVGWPTDRRNEQEMSAFFGRFGPLIECVPWHSAAAARVTFSSRDCARTAINSANGKVLDGFPDPIELVAIDGCKECEELRREIQQLKRAASSARNRSPPRRERTR